MAKNTTTSTKTKQLTAYQKEQIETLKKINEFKEACEANIVGIIYKNPDLLRQNHVELTEFTNNVWRVYFEISKEIILVEKKNTLDPITVGIYLEKHPKLAKRYDEYGGYTLVENAGTYIKEENFDGYLSELRKWNAVIKLEGRGFGVVDRLKDFCDMTAKNDVEVIDFGMIDSSEKAYKAIPEILSANVDVLFCNMVTYATSSVFAPL